MTYHRRPTDREIDKRLKEAKDTLRKKSAAFANYQKAVGELMDLEIEDTNELWDLILTLLEEITIGDYKGGHPPNQSTERTIQDCELWAFAWDSNSQGKKMYLKFVLKNECFYYVSLHESKYPKA